MENQNKHLGRFIRTTTQQNNIHWSDQAEIYTFAHNTQTLTHSQLSPYEMVFKEKPRIPIEFHLEITRDQNSICTSSFGRYLPTHSLHTLTNRKKNSSTTCIQAIVTIYTTNRKIIFLHLLSSKVDN